MNDLYPILDILECLSLVCADRLTCLTLICLCNAKASQDSAAHLYAQKTLKFITQNAKTLSDPNFSALVTECVKIAAKVNSVADDGLDLLTDKITNGETKISNLIRRSKTSIFEIFI